MLDSHISVLTDHPTQTDQGTGTARGGSAEGSNLGA